MGCYRYFPDEEIIEAKMGGGHIVIPLCESTPSFFEKPSSSSTLVREVGVELTQT